MSGRRRRRVQHRAARRHGRCGRGDAGRAPRSADATQRSILIVDDEAEIRETLAAILTGARHRVVTAGSGREALERMAAEHFDVILTDIRMPDLDGRALYPGDQASAGPAGGRVVFVTGDTLASALREFVAESGRPVIEKPFLPAKSVAWSPSWRWTARPTDAPDGR